MPRPEHFDFEPVHREVLPGLTALQSRMLEVFDSGSDAEVEVLLAAQDTYHDKIRAEFTTDDLKKSVHWHALIGSGLPASAKIHEPEREHIIGTRIIEILQENLPDFLLDNSL